MNSGVTGVESAGGGLRRVALRREAVARWALYERGREWCGECWRGLRRVASRGQAVARWALYERGGVPCGGWRWGAAEVTTGWVWLGGEGAEFGCMQVCAVGRELGLALVVYIGSSAMFCAERVSCEGWYGCCAAVCWNYREGG